MTWGCVSGRSLVGRAESDVAAPVGLVEAAGPGLRVGLLGGAVQPMASGSGCGQLFCLAAPTAKADKAGEEGLVRGPRAASRAGDSACQDSEAHGSPGWFFVF